MSGSAQQGEGGDAELLQVQRSLASVYKVERLLVRRGNTVVYQAAEINPARPVALRIFPPSLGLGPSAGRFREVARTALVLNHPNIVPIYRVGFKAGVPFFAAMKLVDGRYLDDVIASQGGLPVPPIVAVLRAAAAALAFAHGRGTVHGALTSSTVLVDRNGLVMLAEFGIARAVDDAAVAAGGQARHGSPEEAGGGAGGPASDQYALGAVALAMLTGNLVPEADPLETLREVRAARPALPDPLVRMVQTVLARDPAERFARTPDMVAAINAIPFSDADGREAAVTLGRLARGEPVSKLRSSAAAPPSPATRAAAREARPAGVSEVAPEELPAVLPEARATQAAPTTPPARPRPPAASPPPAAPAVQWPDTPLPERLSPEPIAPGPIAPEPIAPPPLRAAPEPPSRARTFATPSEPMRGIAPGEPAPPRRRSRVSGATVGERLIRTEPAARAGGRRLLGVLAGLVVLAAAAGAYLLLGRRAAAPTSEPPTTPQAPAASPTPAPSPTVPAAPPTAQAPTTTDTAAAAVATGQLTFNVDPATAVIALDGNPIGRAGYVNATVQAGRRRLEITADGFNAFDSVIVVPRGDALDLGMITLETPAEEGAAASRTGLLRLSADPATAQILIEGHVVSTGSLVDWEAAPGQYRVRVAAPGYAAFDTVVTLTAGTTTRLGQISLRRGSGGP